MLLKEKNFNFFLENRIDLLISNKEVKNNSRYSKKVSHSKKIYIRKEEEVEEMESLWFRYYAQGLQNLYF